MARRLSARLDATLILSNYSRLVIDCNRNPGHPDSILATSDGIEIPGNTEITELDSMRRRRALFEPYQLAIANVLGQRDQRDIRLLSIHSFTPSLNGVTRPWSAGVCSGTDSRWAREMFLAMKNHTGEIIGYNRPYSIETDCDYTIPVQGDGRGISSLMLEIRQDKLADDLGVQRWCNIIVSILEHPRGLHG